MKSRSSPKSPKRPTRARPRKRPAAPVSPILPVWPLWYDPKAPLGSAIKYIAALTSQFQRVSLVLSKKKPALTLGQPCPTQLQVPILNPNRKELGIIDIGSHYPIQLDPQIRSKLGAVVTELAERWPRSR